MAAFKLQQHSRGGVAETRWPAKAEIFTIWPFIEKKVANPSLGAWVANLGRMLQSPGELLKFQMPKPHPRPINSESQKG